MPKTFSPENRLTITEALRRAQQHIYVARLGDGFYVARPYYGIIDPRGPTTSPSSTTDYYRARFSARRARIAQTVAAVTGDPDLATDVFYSLDSGYFRGLEVRDWRETARRIIRRELSKQRQQERAA
jgi:hypothetical protein